MTSHVEIAKKLANAIGPTPTEEEYLADRVKFWKESRKGDLSWAASYSILLVAFCVFTAEAMYQLPPVSDLTWWDYSLLAFRAVFGVFLFGMSVHSSYSAGVAEARFQYYRNQLEDCDRKKKWREEVYAEITDGK